ncbi:hypothetical protein LINPERHAP2_LOCUS21793 [Linum perenne]
MAEQTSPSSER